MVNTKLPFFLSQFLGHKTWSEPCLISLLFCVVNVFFHLFSLCYVFKCHNEHFFHSKNVAPSQKTGVILHLYLPIMAISLQWPLSTVPKVTVVKKFNCTICCCWLSAQLLWYTCWLYRWRGRLSGSYVHQQITKEGVSRWLGWSLGCHWSCHWSCDWSSHWLWSWSSFLSLRTWTRWMPTMKCDLL